MIKFLDQRWPTQGWLVYAWWLAAALLACTAVLPGRGVLAQEASEIQRRPAAFSQPHLPSDKIAEVFRAQTIVPVTILREGSNANGEQTTSADAEVTQDEIAQWIDQLGWPEFAAREQATAKLREVGKPALPSLRQAAQQHADPEVRIRAGDVSQGISGNETAGRIDAFLAGEDVPMEGWDVARTILGDGVRVRELYVEIALRHQSAAAALEASSKQRSEAFRATIVDIQRGMYVESRLPTEADVIALLLLVNDPDMPISRVEEDAMFTLMPLSATTRLLIDAQLSGMFRALLNGWVARLDVRNYEKLLWFALNCKLESSLPLALSALQKSTEPATLAMAMQAISRFGDKTNIAEIAKYLDDERAASDVQYYGGNVIEPQLRDAAMAAIVLLSGKSLADYHLDANAVHPNFGFVIQSIGFPAENNELRLEAIEKVKKELVPAE